MVRTSPLLHHLDGEVTWITAAGNVILLEDVKEGLRCLPWEQRDLALDSEYDLLINLEDEPDASAFCNRVRHARRFGA